MKTFKDVWTEIKCLWKRVKKLEQDGNGGGSGIQSIQEGDNISIDNTDPQNPVISALGGGGAAFITTTKSNLDTLIANEELIPNALYEITGVQPLLYGGTTIYLQAISTTELNPNGVGKFYNPKYDQTEQGFGIAVDYVHWADVGDQKPSGVYAVNDVVIWGGKHWTCIQPTTTATKYIVDTFNLDTDYFVEIPFNETDYNVAYDAIKYDYENDWIIERNEKNTNVVSFDYEWLRYFDCDFGNCDSDPNNLILLDPIKNFQWGNVFNYQDYVGIGLQRITNSLNQNINFRGSRQTNLTFDNSSQFYLTFDNNSSQFYLTFDNNSYQSYLTFDNSSSQSYLTFDNSYQYNLSFDNSSQSYLTFDNSYQYNLSFDNSSQSYLTTSGSNRRQQHLTFNSFESDRTGQHLASNEENLTFDNTVQNLPQYGQGYVTGTPTYMLGVTAEGEVVEIDDTGGTTPTLSEVLVEGNIADRDIVINNSGLKSGSTTGAVSYFYEEDGFFYWMADIANNGEKVGQLTVNGENVNVDGSGSNNPNFKGITGSSYYGANYDDKTYVQKKYVDDNFLPQPTEGTSGQVLTTDGDGVYTWEDVEVQTYLQSITGYDAGETQTLKNVNGVLTWITD